MAINITPELITTIGNLASYGFSQRYISGAIGISTTTLSRWKHENPEIGNALSVSNDGILQDVKSRLVETALSGSSSSAVSAGQYILNRYETVVIDEVVPVDDEAVKQAILSELSQ